MAEKIPFVFLPLQGQIVYPSRVIDFDGKFPKNSLHNNANRLIILFQGVSNSVCAVSSSQYLTQSGWVILKNKFDGDVPFRLYHENDKTFLQWLGDDDIRARMQGRLVLVHLSCRIKSQNSTFMKIEG